MLEKIEPHTCNRCHTQSVIVWCYTISDGQYVQLCRECASAVLGQFMSNATENTVKKYIPIAT